MEHQCTLCRKNPLIPGFLLHRIIPTLEEVKNLTVTQGILGKWNLSSTWNCMIKKLTHLENTTIHIADVHAVSLTLMEHAALIIYNNTWGLDIKIKLYQAVSVNTDYGIPLWAITHYWIQLSKINEEMILRR